MQDSKPTYNWIFETSWEVCNKIGGIYTVLSTKAQALQDLDKDKTVFIGPDVWTEQNPSPYFKEYKSLLKNAASRMELPWGISIRVGRWAIPGSPLAVLVKFDSVYGQLPRIYGRMWELFGVDSLHSYGDYDEGCAFAVASAIVMKALTEHLKEDPSRIMAHFNEWTTAMGLLYLEDTMPKAATVFTTHATSIGRSICGNGKPLYDYFEGYNGDQMAQELNMQSKHSLEKAAAHHADCFTTVSDVTARECAQLLDIKPQAVTPNGFEPGFVPDTKTWGKVRAHSRQRLLAVARAVSGKTISSDALVIATSGRNEYRNKGIDVFIDAMDRLSSDPHLEKDIVAYIMVPSWSADSVEGVTERMQGCLGEEPKVRFATHHLHNEESDAIFTRLRELNANTDLGGKVTLIYLPCYLDGNDGVLDLTYYDMMPGLDLTVFPSYYEPWGYTPLESIAFGIPTVSSDKAGFGQWIEKDFDPTFQTCGVEVLQRTDSNYNDVATEISRKVKSMAMCGEKEKEMIRRAACATASQADWHIFIKEYLRAFAIADSRRDQRIGK